MDLLVSLGVLVRRWYIVVPLLAITASAAVQADRRMEPSYSASGRVLLLAPAQAVDPETGRGNPFSAYGNLKIPASVVSEVVRQPQVRERLRSAGAGADYAVGVDALSDAPIVVVSAAGRARDVRGTVRMVMAEVEAQLERLQREVGAPAVTAITARPLTQPERITPQTGSRLRVLAAAVFAGLTLTVATAFLVEGVAEGLRRRRGAAQRRGRVPRGRRARRFGAERKSDEAASVELEADPTPTAP